jgi:hypothetical protein
MNAIEWVALAASVDHPTYPQLDHVRVIDGMAMATDGFRVHRSRDHELSDGWYSKTLQRVDGAQCVNYPDVGRKFDEAGRNVPTLVTLDMFATVRLDNGVVASSIDDYWVFDSNLILDALVGTTSFKCTGSRAYSTIRATGYSAYGEFIVMGISKNAKVVGS